MKNQSWMGPIILCLLLMISHTLALADERSDRADKLFAEWGRPDSPGVSLAIIENGKIIYERGYGSANIELNVPLSPKSLFYIASTSKQFTAMCIALLAQKGKLSLDDDVRKYIPELPDYGTPITIRQLIHHTSGIRDELTLVGIAGKNFGDFHKDDLLALICRQKELNFEPGTQDSYSNSGFTLLAIIVERVSGKSFREFAEDAIFKPLGMIHSGFHDDYKIPIMNRASGYFSTPEKGKFLNYITTYDGVGAGGLYASVEDLYLWDQNFYDAKVGGPDLIQQIQTPGVLKNGGKLDYAFGLMLGTYRGLKIVQHGGILEGYRAELLRFPEQRFSVICLANLSSIDPTKLCHQVADIYLAGRFKEDPSEAQKRAEKVSFIKLPESKLKELAGTYLKPEDRTLLNLTVTGNQLTVVFEGRPFPLDAVSETEFRVMDVIVFKFERPGAGKPAAMTLFLGEQKPVRYERFEPLSLTADELKAVAGDYWSDELEVTFRLALKEGKLFFVHKNAPADALTPTALDRFAVGSFALRMVRDPRKKISGFRLDTPRAKNFLFERIEEKRSQRVGR